MNRHNQTPNLDEIAAGYQRAYGKLTRRVVVCAGTGCLASGSQKIYQELVRLVTERKLPVVVSLEAENDPPAGSTYVSQSGCQGFCQKGPLVTVFPENTMYTRVTVADVAEIVDETLIGGRLVERLLYVNPANGTRCQGPEQIPFYNQQQRMVLKACGHLAPEDIREYIGHEGYFAARRAFTGMTPAEICQEIIDSGLRGRGGGGFPTGRKWELTRQQTATQKYVVCNGDEGDPGAFMDRSVMEGNPHSVLEGLMIAAAAIGADKAYIYVRAEYPLAVRRLRHAVAEATQLGLLGDDVFGSGRTFGIEVMEGAGAFVCGEETALLGSIEGKRGMPMPKPPFPAEKGLFGCPTVINNVETLASVPLILRMGAKAYRAIGTPTSPGTKNFALTGNVANTGLIEVPFGATLREIVYNIGGGATDSRGNISNLGFKAVQIGGPSGGCLTAEHLDLPLDFDSLKSVNAMVGSGGLVVMNQETCMVKLAQYFMQFAQNESCGKCVLCREGTRQMLLLLEDISEGRADENTVPLLESTARAVQIGSLCGLGKTAPNPVLSTLRYFREEVMAHVREKRCPTGKCKALAKPKIDPAKCKGCGLCAMKCPVKAIHGEKRQPHQIDESLCIKCGVCAASCKFKAVYGIGA